MSFNPRSMLESAQAKAVESVSPSPSYHPENAAKSFNPRSALENAAGEAARAIHPVHTSRRPSMGKVYDLSGY